MLSVDGKKYTNDLMSKYLLSTHVSRKKPHQIIQQWFPPEYDGDFPDRDQTMMWAVVA